MALRENASVADVRLKWKLCYKGAKLKAKGRLRSRPVRYAPVSQHECAMAIFVATTSCQDLNVISSIPNITNGKCRGLKRTLNATFIKVNGVWAVLPKRHLENLQVIRLRVPTPLDQVLLLTVMSALLGRRLHMELNFSLLIDQGCRRSVYRRKCTLS